jgi:membrane protein implicated in regulation of membrane protease activity
VQSANDFLVFSVQAVVALSSGWFLYHWQWQGLLVSVIPPVLAFAWLAWRSRAYADLS